MEKIKKIQVNVFKLFTLFTLAAFALTLAGCTARQQAQAPVKPRPRQVQNTQNLPTSGESDDAAMAIEAEDLKSDQDIEKALDDLDNGSANEPSDETVDDSDIDNF